MYDPQSRNEEDQCDQKELWIKLHEKTKFYSQSAFRDGLKAEAFIHHDGVTHKCMTFLQNASTNVDSNTGLWRLWDKPLPISRAEERLSRNNPKVKTEDYMDMEVDDTQFGTTKGKEDEEQQKEHQRKREHGRRVAHEALVRERIAREDSLARHKANIDRELSPERDGTKVNYAWKQKERWDDYDTGARSNNETPMWTGTKRSLTTPTSPEGIAKAAKLQWTTEKEK